MSILHEGRRGELEKIHIETVKFYTYAVKFCLKQENILP